MLTSGAVPKHVQLRQALIARIEDHMSAGDRVPSERSLMVEHGVSRMTVREAIGQLVSEGRLERIRGKGTFVARPRIDSHLNLSSFTDDITSRGLRPSTVVLAAQQAVPPPATARALGLAPRAEAYRVRRIRLADDTPVKLEDGWYDAQVVPGLLQHDLSRSLYATLQARYGVTIDSATQTVWAEAARGSTATLLGVHEGAPLLVFERIASAAGRVVEHQISWYGGERYQVHMALAGVGAGATTRV